MKPLNREGMEQLIKDIEANERAKCEAEFKQKLYELDWAKILHEAIIMAAFISRLKKQKVIT